MADSRQAENFIQGRKAEHLLADKAYDTDAIIIQFKIDKIQMVVPAKRNRKEQRDYDKELYKSRHLVESAFLYLKRWRGIATRYFKNSASFLAAIQIGCLDLWLKIS